MEPNTAKLYRAPELSDLEVTPRRVRDELVLCFMSALSCVPLPKGAEPLPRQAVRLQVEAFVRESFAASGASYDEPTRESILSTMHRCRERVEEARVPSDDVKHHWNEMMRLVDRLPPAIRAPDEAAAQEA